MLALMMVLAVNSRVSKRWKACWRFSPPTATPWFSRMTQEGPDSKVAGDGFSEGHGAGELVGGVSDTIFSADVGGLGEEVGVGDLAADGEGDECDGVGVDDGVDVGADFVDGFVEGVFGGGFVESFDGAIGADADDVFAAEGAFVDAGGGDPDVSELVFDREISAGGGGHFVGVDAFEGVGEFDAWVDEGACHVGSSGGIRAGEWGLGKWGEFRISEFGIQSGEGRGF